MSGNTMNDVLVTKSVTDKKDLKNGKSINYLIINII